MSNPLVFLYGLSNWRSHLFLHLLLLLLTFGTIPLYSALPPDWELAVAQGKKVILLSLDNSSTSIQLPPLSHLKVNGVSDSKSVFSTNSNDKSWHIDSLALDPGQNTIFYTQVSPNGTSIGSLGLLQNTSRLLFQGSKNVIEGLIYHQNSLLWMDGTLKTIMRLNLSDLEQIKNPQILLNLSNSSPHGISASSKNQMLFWADWSKDKASILYLNLNNSEIGIFVSSVYQPHALATDEEYLYFADNHPGVHFTIERVSLRNSSFRQLLHKGSYQHPYSLSPICGVGVFWTDLMSKTLVFLQFYQKDTKLPRIEQSTAILRQFKSLSPFGLVLNPHSCQITFKNLIQGSNGGSELEGNTFIHEEIPSPFMLKDVVVTKRTQMVNKSGNLGFCDDSLILSSPLYCLNGAKCIILDEEIYCLCSPGFVGPTCANSWPILSEKDTQINPEPASSLFLTVACGILGILLLLACAGLSYLYWRVWKLDKKPKIRRRVIVSRSASELSTGQSGSYCEMIDIENCCNMNICETPCYERHGAGSGPSSSKGKKEIKDKSHGSRKEDKEKLLQHSS